MLFLPSLTGSNGYGYGYGDVGERIEWKVHKSSGLFHDRYSVDHDDDDHDQSGQTAATSANPYGSTGPRTVKAVLLGAPGVGKTAIIQVSSFTRASRSKKAFRADEGKSCE